MKKVKHGWIGDEPNKSYCDRLVELAFPESVWIEGESFNKAELELRFYRGLFSSTEVYA